MQRRLTAINTSRPSSLRKMQVWRPGLRAVGSRSRGPCRPGAAKTQLCPLRCQGPGCSSMRCMVPPGTNRRPTAPCLRPQVRGHAGAPTPSPQQNGTTQAAIAQDLEAHWMAALTPGSSDLEAAVQAAQARAARGAAAPLPTLPAGPFAAAAQVAFEGPFAAAAQVAFDSPTGTLPAGGGLGPGLQHAAALPPGRPVAMPAPARQSSMARAGSASITIPYHTMRRAETAPALTDDLIAAAMAVAGGSSASSGSALARAAAAAVAAAASGSSAGSSYRGSPPKAPPASVPERQASATREVFEAQAEAVAALTQAKVLQQALAQVGGAAWLPCLSSVGCPFGCLPACAHRAAQAALLACAAAGARRVPSRAAHQRPAVPPVSAAQEQERVDRLEQQLRSLMRERAEEQARHQAEAQRWAMLQEQQARYLQALLLQQQQQQQQQQHPAPAAPSAVAAPRLAQQPPRLLQQVPRFQPPPAAQWAAGPGRQHQPMSTWLEETYSQIAVEQMSMLDAPEHMPTVPEQAQPEQAAAAAPGAGAAGGLERQQPASLDALATALAAMES